MDQSETNPEAKLALALSAEQKNLMENVPRLNPDVVAVVQQSRDKTVYLSIGQLDELADALSGEANHTEGTILQRKLDTLVRKIDRVTVTCPRFLVQGL